MNRWSVFGSFTQKFTELNSNKKMKIASLIFLFSVSFLCKGYSNENSLETTRLDSSKKVVSKNIIRVEAFGRSFMYGLVYERLIVEKKWSLYSALNASYLGEEDFAIGTSIYTKKSNKRLTPMFGLGLGVGLKQASFEIAQEPERISSRYYFPTIITGVDWNIGRTFNIQIYYTPYLLFIEKSLRKPIGTMLYGGVNLGYKF